MIVSDQTAVQMRRIEKDLADINQTLRTTNTLLHELLQVIAKATEKREVDG